MKSIVVKSGMLSIFFAAAVFCFTGCSSMIDDHLLGFKSSIFSGNASLDRINDTNVTFNASLDRSGKIYYAVMPNGSARPAATDIINDTVSASVKSGSVLTDAEKFYIEVTGLNKETAYDLYVVGVVNESEKDEVDNEYTDVKKLDFTTKSAYLVSITPANGAVNVPLKSNIKMVFSYPLNSLVFGSVSLNGTTYTHGSNCTMTIVYNTLEINPYADFTANTKYTSLYVYGFKTTDGLELLHVDLTYSFTTIVEDAQLVSITPADESVSVAVNTNIVMNFSVNLNTSTIGTVTLNTEKGSGNSGASITYQNGVNAAISVSGSAITLNPYSDLVNGGEYKGITIYGFKTSTSGITIDYQDSGYNFVTIGTPVSIKEIIPANGKQSVPITTTITVICSDELNSSYVGSLTLNGTTYSNGVNAVITVSGTSIVVDPNVNFSYNTEYTNISFTGFLTKSGMAVSYSDTAYNFRTINSGTLPNVYMLVDHSGSMSTTFAKYTYDANNCYYVNGVKYYTPIVVEYYGVKWDMVQKVISETAEAIVPNCNVGLATYATVSDYIEKLNLQSGNNAYSLAHALDGVTGSGGSQHALAMLKTYNDGNLSITASDSNKKILVLITDGDNKDGCIDAVTTLKNAGIKVYVVGVGNIYVNKPADFISRGEENYLQTMEEIAVAAGTRNPFDSTKHWIPFCNTADFKAAMMYIMNDY